MIGNRDAGRFLRQSGKHTGFKSHTSNNNHTALIILFFFVISVFTSCSILAGEAYPESLDTQIEQPIRILVGLILVGFFILLAVCTSRDIYTAVIRNNEKLRNCRYCLGEGRLTMINNPFYKTTCPACKGTGKIKEEK